ncbi:PEP-CTERM sorting domain-containing protein [Desulfobulbus sp.]|uniref:PEP-CTERM sorting domain-containing protein n=1 Tax=Desulfobulbus sp. TaxID=895 RepID=UPI00286EDF15|nr:PEP-CTERM sorting domain-containing protein [Desulfobulbus sp.]
MKNLLLGLIVIGLSSGLANVAQANLIVNGSFEENVVSPGSWSVFSSIDGWTATSGPGIEIQNNVAGSPYDGMQFVELDSHGNSAMAQSVSTDSGQLYLLEFAYSPRPGIGSGSNLVDVFWNGISLTNNVGITANGASDTLWSLMHFQVTGTGADTLSFAALGTSDSFGGYLDSVSLNSAGPGTDPVPEPATVLLFATGLAGLAGTARRKK